MDARIVRTVMIAVALSSLGASYRTQNFVINAPTQHAAELACLAAVAAQFAAQPG